MPGPSSPPDVVLILTDQWNPRMMGCYGDSAVRTPHLDRLAREGVRFDNAYASSPVCMPARCSLVSGQFPHRHGFWTNFTGLKFPADRVTLFHALREKGYTTAKIGKYHLFNPEAGEDHRDHGDYYDALGLDWAQELPTPYMGPYLRNEYTRFLEQKGMLQPYIDDIAARFVGGDHHVVRPSPLTPDEHIDGYVARQAERYIETCIRERPMFLCVSFPGPHTPFDAPRPYSDMYAPEAMTLAPNVPAKNRQGHEHAHIRRMQANYFGKLTHLDDRVGALLQALDRRGNLANTLVLFAADHGEYLGSHGRYGKGDFHEESARIPLLMRWPERIRPHQTCATPVSWLDLYATVLHAAGRDDHSTPAGSLCSPWPHRPPGRCAGPCSPRLGTVGASTSWCGSETTNGSSPTARNSCFICPAILTSNTIWRRKPAPPVCASTCGSVCSNSSCPIRTITRRAICRCFSAWACRCPDRRMPTPFFAAGSAGFTAWSLDPTRFPSHDRQP